MDDKTISNSRTPFAVKQAIGYKNPPVNTRFKPGTSGNPKGRPKKNDNDPVKKPRVRTTTKDPERKNNGLPQVVRRVLTEPEISEEVAKLSLDELRDRWAKAWGLKPHKYIRRNMLEKSLIFKVRELNGLGLTRLQQAKLDQLVKTYKRNPKCFDDRIGLKAGIRLVRTWKGVRQNVLVREDGFEYNGVVYKSLSRVAKEITGTTWNGWKFFHLKRKKK